MIVLKGSVLFVDDQAEITDLIKRVLKDEDYVQYFTNSGTEALEILESNIIDVVVTDVVMPLVSGFQLLNILKKRYPETVRIVLSGQLQIASVLAAINSGEVYRYITKPWKVNEEAKQIIRDALEYSAYLRQKRTHTGEAQGGSCLRDGSFIKIIQCLDKPNFLTHAGNVIEVASKWKLPLKKGDSVFNLDGTLDLSQYSCIELCSGYSLYLKQF